MESFYDYGPFWACHTHGWLRGQMSVSQRGPIRGEATIEGDRTTTQSEQDRKKSSGSPSASGSVSGSGSASGSVSER
jgi:hypothetical protein